MLSRISLQQRKPYPSGRGENHKIQKT